MVCTMMMPFGHPLLGALPRASLSCVSKPRTIHSYSDPVHRVHHCEDGDVLEIELPGVSKENVVVEVKENTLTVTGERSGRRSGDEMASKEEETDKASSSEHCRVAASEGSKAIDYLRYRIVFEVGGKLSLQNAEAHMENGLLMVKLPRTEPEKHRISISG